MQMSSVQFWKRIQLLAQSGYVQVDCSLLFDVALSLKVPLSKILKSFDTLVECGFPYEKCTIDFSYV